MNRSFKTMITAAGLAAAMTTAASASAQTPTDVKAPPAKTVVLVHGAWADGSSWSKVIPLLQKAGLNVVAVQNPLASLQGDTANTTRVINDQAGDVILVGHSYGGMIISEAGNNPKVKSLVYVAAFSPMPSQSVNSILAGFEPPPWLTLLHLDQGGYLTWPAEPMAQYFASGLPAAEARVIAATQHPTFFHVNDDKIGDTVAYSTRPTFSVISQKDLIIPAPLQQHFAEIMKSEVVPVQSGHLPMLAEPQVVANAIIQASKAF